VVQLPPGSGENAVLNRVEQAEEHQRDDPELIPTMPEHRQRVHRPPGRFVDVTPYLGAIAVLLSHAGRGPSPKGGPDHLRDS